MQYKLYLLKLTKIKAKLIARFTQNQCAIYMIMSCAIGVLWFPPCLLLNFDHLEEKTVFLWPFL